MATKLWDKGFEPDKMIEEYTVGNDRELDMRLTSRARWRISPCSKRSGC
jgi:hypothetical protein